MLGTIGDRQVRSQLTGLFKPRAANPHRKGVMRMEDGLSDLIDPGRFDLYRAVQACSKVRPARSNVRRAVQQFRTVNPLSDQPLEECSNE